MFLVSSTITTEFSSSDLETSSSFVSHDADLGIVALGTLSPMPRGLALSMPEEPDGRSVGAVAPSSRIGGCSVGAAGPSSWAGGLAPRLHAQSNSQAGFLPQPGQVAAPQGGTRPVGPHIPEDLQTRWVPALWVPAAGTPRHGAGARPARNAVAPGLGPLAVSHY